MSKKLFTALIIIASILSINSTFAAPNMEQKQIIPYPDGLDTTSEGASSAPSEINHSDSIYFKDIDFYDMQSTKSRIILPHYPTYQQTRENTCGPAAALTVMYYYGNYDYDEMSLTKGMKTKPYPIGSNPRDMANFFKNIGWYVDSSINHKSFTKFNDFKNWVLENLNKGIPIMVENVEWGGHWRVIIGYDTIETVSDVDDILIMMDSYDVSDHNQDGYAINNAYRFYSMWFDHSMLPKKQKNQPWVITYPKQ